MNVFENAGKSVFNWAVKNAPTLLTCAGAAGVILTAVASGKAAIKAKKVLDEMPEGTDTLDKVKAVAPIIAKPAFLACGTMWVIFSANKVALRRNAALVAAYTLSSNRLEEYENKVVETIGENKNKKIKDAIAEDSVEKTQMPETIVFSNSEGKTICFDRWSGQYFNADIEYIRSVQNDLDDLLLQNDFVALNEYYERLGMNTVANGEDIGWNRADNPETRVKFEYSSTLKDNKYPVLVISFEFEPKESFYKNDYESY